MTAAPDPAKITCYAASAVIVNNQDEILLLLRDDMPLWTNIGGNREPGEDFETCMRREVREEVSLEVDIIRFTGDFYSPLPDGNYRHQQVFLCKPQKHQIPVLGDEGIKMAWINRTTLPLNMGPRYRIWIEAALNKKHPISMILDNVPGMLDFLNNCTNFNDFCGLAEWLYHPKVMQKRDKNQLQFDVKI